MLALVVAGTVGYRWGGLSWIDALYQTVITLSTVGYEDLAPEHRAFTIALVGIGTLGFIVMISLLTASLVETRISDIIGRRRVESRIKNLSDHFIICGGGRFGRTIAADFTRRGVAFVIIERAADRVEEARSRDFLTMQADATEEEVLEFAGIARARGLLATLSSDADNVYVTLTAKQMAPQVSVVSIASDERAARKLKSAGADEVVAPYVLGGNWMAQAVTSPTVADFMRVTTREGVDFHMDEQAIGEKSELAGVKLKDAPIRSRFGVTVVAVQRVDGTMTTNPDGDLELVAGDVLVSLGRYEQLSALKRLAAGR